MILTLKQPLILASSSPYRKAILEKLQLPFSTVSPNIDETPHPHEAPEETALRLARLKARKVAETHSDALIIGCDQVATVDGLQIGKPRNHENAVKQLTMLSGKEVIFHSAICLLNAETKHEQAQNVPTYVKFRTLETETIEQYLRIEQPYDCAGSAKSEGLGISLLDYIKGDDPNALIGLPLIRLIDFLEKNGLNLFQPDPSKT